MLVSVN